MPEKENLCNSCETVHKSEEIITKHVYLFTHLPSNMKYIGLCQEAPEKHFRRYWLDAQNNPDSSRKLNDFLNGSLESEWEVLTVYKSTAPKEHNWAFAQATYLETRLILALRTYDPYGLNLTLGGTSTHEYETWTGKEPNPVFAACPTNDPKKLCIALMRDYQERNLREVWERGYDMLGQWGWMKKTLPGLFTYPGLREQFGEKPWSPLSSHLAAIQGNPDLSDPTEDHPWFNKNFGRPQNKADFELFCNDREAWNKIHEPWLKKGGI